MFRFSHKLQGALLLALMIFSGSYAAPEMSLSNIGLQGSVKSGDGKPMEGVAVSARMAGKSITTSVYTDVNGEYYFPTLAQGHYQIWAQAVGFQFTNSELNVAAGRPTRQDFQLKSIANFQMQLSGTEWTQSLPGDSVEDRRMRDVFHNNCSSCHVAAFALTKRFDSNGWATIVNAMIQSQTPPDSPMHNLITAYKDELVEYLTRVRGPSSPPLNFQIHPRVRGEAAAVVVVEYEVPRGDDPKFVAAPDGSNWSQGPSSRSEGEVLHDVAVGKDGNVYFSDNTTPERTVGRLNPNTGEVKTFKLTYKDGLAVRTHGIVTDQAGDIWLTNQTDGSIIKFDPRKEQFQTFPKPANQPGKVGGAIDVDSKGIVWTSANIGTMRLDPKTAQYTDYQALFKGGAPYGVTVDADNNAWMAQLGADRLMVVNGKDGKVSEVALEPLPGVSAKDWEIGKAIGGATNTGPLYLKGPRRLWADKSGDIVWVAEHWAGQLTKINIRTKKITEYDVPNRYSHSYAIAVDKNHMVWICLMNSDRIAKFNPYTEEFTEYPLPTLGTNVRHITVDNSTNPPTIWIPYTGVNKVAKMTFRMNPPSTNSAAAN